MSRVAENDDAILEEYATKYPPLITVEHASEIAHVPIATIYSWSSADRLDAFKVRVGRNILFRRDAFINFLLSNSQLN